jgi:site-specific DNA recombinase
MGSTSQTKATYSPISEPDGNGGKKYRKSKTTTVRPREEWIAVPVPAYLSRELVERARRQIKAHKPSERRYLTRPWELRGLVRCSCGRLMTTHTVNPRKDKLYHYYTCRDRDRGVPGAGCKEKSLNATKTETRVWGFISDILSDPEKLKDGIERLIDWERNQSRGGDDQERKTWETKLSECANLRAAYQDQQAAGLMTLDELKEKLERLEETRTLALSELSKIEGRLERITALEEDKDALLEQYSALVPEGLTKLSPQEKNHLYHMLKLEVAPTEEGLQVIGIFGDVCISRTAMNTATLANSSGVP